MILGSNQSFRFSLPPVVEFGRGVVGKVPGYCKQLAMKKPLLLADPFFLDSAAYRDLCKGLEDAGNAAVTWSGVVPNPTDVSTDEAADVYRHNECDGIVAVGGGSAMDTAKGVAIVVQSDGDSIRPYTPPTWKHVESMAPLILVPTTSGTGAEVNPWAMISNTETDRKDVGYDASALLEAQRVAIVDPDLTASMPPMLTAVTGMDAFCHAEECFLCESPNPLSDVIAYRAIELVARSLARAVHNGDDMEARTDMSLASLLATTAFPNADLTYPHRLSAPLYDRWGLAHGLTVAVLTVASLELLLPFKTERLAKVAEAFGVTTLGLTTRETAERGIQAVSQMMRDIGVPTFKEASGASIGDVEKFMEQQRKENPAPKQQLDRYEWVLKRSLEL